MKLQLLQMVGIKAGILCIDEVVYHVGASIKDLGKKWFAFSKLENEKTETLVSKIA